MCRLISIGLLFLLSCACMNPAQADPKYPGVGRSATARAIQAWNIDVRPDFKGLPKGAGTVLQGQQVWDCLLYTSPSPRDRQKSRMPSSA